MEINTETHDERWEYQFLSDVLRWLRSHDSEFRNARISGDSIKLFDTFDNVERKFHSLNDLREWLGY
jgi:hypothetical protein